MTVETLFPNGDDNGWPTGDWTDIDESIASADGLTFETSIDNDVVIIDLDASAITDGDTVNTVTVKIRAKDTGAGGKNKLAVDVDVGGGGLGVIVGANLTNAYATYTFVNSLWNLDHTAAQMDAMQLIIRADQTGMGAAADWIIDAIDVDIDYTAGGGGQNIAVGQVTENESLFAVTPEFAQNISAGQVTENESLFAVAVDQGQIIAVGQVTENESLFSPSVEFGQNVAVGQVTENESLFSPAVEQGTNIAVGPVTENEFLFSPAVEFGQSISVGQVTENENLFVVGVEFAQSIAVGQVAENESLFSPTVEQGSNIAVGLVAENESLFSPAVEFGQNGDVGQVTENESLFAVVVQLEVFTGGIYNAREDFATGGTVTITIYDTANGNVVATSTADCSEFASTGSYVWGSQNLVVQPTGRKEYGYEMTNGTLFKSGLLLVNTDAVAELMALVMENGETFGESYRLIRANAAGDIIVSGGDQDVMSADGLTKRIEATADETGRTVTAVDGS